jgi:hypothetical protein
LSFSALLLKESYFRGSFRHFPSTVGLTGHFGKSGSVGRKKENRSKATFGISWSAAEGQVLAGELSEAHENEGLDDVEVEGYSAIFAVRSLR